MKKPKFLQKFFSNANEIEVKSNMSEDFIIFVKINFPSQGIEGIFGINRRLFCRRWKEIAKE